MRCIWTKHRQPSRTILDADGSRVLRASPDRTARRRRRVRIEAQIRKPVSRSGQPTSVLRTTCEIRRPSHQ